MQLILQIQQNLPTLQNLTYFANSSNFAKSTSSKHFSNSTNKTDLIKMQIFAQIQQIL